MGLRLRALLYVAAAFALGLLLFLAIWLKQRNSNDFYHVDGASKSATGSEFEPLPGPDMDAVGRIEQQTPPDSDNSGNARVVETAPPRPPPTQPRPAAPASPPAPVASGASSDPVPVSSPPPRYPADAMRRGESGDVLVRVQVGADGVPTAVEVARSSHSRSLDRAAIDAVRQWRFQPARRDGQAVEGTVQVPISFNPGR